MNYRYNCYTSKPYIPANYVGTIYSNHFLGIVLLGSTRFVVDTDTILTANQPVGQVENSAQNQYEFNCFNNQKY
jgi:hypothetical protein